MGDRIRQLLDARGMSIAELARRVGVERAAAQKWISGDTQNMKNATLLLVARELHTDAPFLVWGKDRYDAVKAPSPSPQGDGAGRARDRS